MKFSDRRSLYKWIDCRKALYLIFFTIIFGRMFLISGYENWGNKFHYFNVPSNSFPGGDARNIQMSVICLRNPIEGLTIDQCVTNGKDVADVYHGAKVPLFNYPNIWLYIFKFLGADTEAGFMRFWLLNAVAIISCIAVVCWRFNPYLFPLFAFSPLTLLAVERGNIDASVFSVVFILSMFRNPFIAGIGEGMGAALKIFPIFGAIGHFLSSDRSQRRKLAIAYLLTLPLFLWSASQIFRILRSTASGFTHAYGFLSIYKAPFFQNHYVIASFFLSIYTGIAVVTIILMLRWQPYRRLTKEYFSSRDFLTLRLTVVSLSIFVGTHLFFDSYDYRLVFSIPATIVLLGMPGRINRSLGCGFVILHVVTLLPFGWTLANLVAYALAPFCWSLLIIILTAAPRTVGGSSPATH